MEINQPGIYAIRCLRDGKGTTYVGQAGVTIAQRFRSHKKMLRGGRHANKHLQRAWNYYGPDAFEFIILENISDRKQLSIREQFWLDKIRESYPVYNFGTVTANPMLGQTHTPEVRRRLSETHKGKKFAEEQCRRISEALTGHPVSEKTRQAVSNRWKTRESDSPITRWLKGIAFRGKRFTKEHCDKISMSQAKPYPEFINQDTGEIIPAGIGLNRLCKERGLEISKMSSVIHGKRKHHHGWTVKKT